MPKFEALIEVVNVLRSSEYQVRGKGATVGERLYFLHDYFTTWW